MIKEKSQENVFAITLEDLQSEAKEKIGGEQTPTEILFAKTGLECGLLFNIRARQEFPPDGL